jgi:hypothetical protein
MKRIQIIPLPPFLCHSVFDSSKKPSLPKVLVRKPWGCEWTKHSPFAQAVKRREHTDGMKNITISMDDDL